MADGVRRRPVVAVTVSLDPGKRIRPGHDYLYLKRTYPACIAQAGGSAFLVGPDVSPEAVASTCDALVISGGDDLPETFANGPALESPTAEVAERIRWERLLIDEFARAGKPLLGVCYGMQLINLHFGGTLHVEIGGRGGPIEHGGGGVSTTHAIETAPGSALRGLLGARATICSSHHQAVDKVAPGFTVAARAVDGVIEAIERDRIMGVEWHAESDATGPAVYGHLLSLVTGH